MSLPNLSQLVQTEGAPRDGNGNRAADNVLQGDLAPGILSHVERYEVNYAFNAKLDLRDPYKEISLVLPLQTRVPYTREIERVLDRLDLRRVKEALTATVKEHLVKAISAALKHEDLDPDYRNELEDLKQRMNANAHNVELRVDVKVTEIPDTFTKLPSGFHVGVGFGQQGAQKAMDILVLLSTKEEPRVERLLEAIANDVASAVAITIDFTHGMDLVDWTQRAGERLNSDLEKVRDDWYKLSRGPTYGDWYKSWVQNEDGHDEDIYNWKTQLMFERRYYGTIRLQDRKIVPPSKEWQQVIELVRQQQRQEAAMRES